ncbi:MAG: cbb3-type cytochrome c oxidase N-terminal domain-containing protein [Oceanipulchritudo sp.]
MSKTDKPRDENLRPHVYDGIEEYDNRLPNWWLWTFYLAVIFSVIYWFSFYNAEVMESDAATIESQMARVEEARLASVGEINNDTLWQMSRNEGFVSSGANIYKDNCVACHGAELEGGIGLNLADNEWKWGNEPVSIYTIVTRGSPDKSAGMQAWVSELGPQKVSQVVAYILSYHSREEMAEAETLNPPLGM